MKGISIWLSAAVVCCSFVPANAADQDSNSGSSDPSEKSTAHRMSRFSGVLTRLRNAGVHQAETNPPSKDSNERGSESTARTKNSSSNSPISSTLYVPLTNTAADPEAPGPTAASAAPQSAASQDASTAVGAVSTSSPADQDSVSASSIAVEKSAAPRMSRLAGALARLRNRGDHKASANAVSKDSNEGNPDGAKQAASETSSSNPDAANSSASSTATPESLSATTSPSPISASTKDGAAPPTPAPYKKTAIEHYNHAVELHQSGFFGQAIDEYMVALKLDPRIAPAWCNLGGALLQAGSNKAAVQAFKNAYALDRMRPVTLNGYATALYATDKKSEAIEIWRESIDLDPSFKPSVVNLANALDETGRHEEAVGIRKQAGVADASATSSAGTAAKTY